MGLPPGCKNEIGDVDADVTRRAGQVVTQSFGDDQGVLQRAGLAGVVAGLGDNFD
jgi:hypothetical protein